MKRLVFSAIFLAMQALSASGGEVTTSVSGTFNGSQENACIHVSTFFYLTDCSYGRINETIAGNELPWTGPTVNPVYFAPDSPNAVPDYTPVPGDDRISPTLDGTLTIDDRDTPDPADDLISGVLTVGPTARSVVVNVNELAGGPAGAPPRAIESWAGITHTLAPTAVNETAANEFGGIDYVIGSRGFPSRLCHADNPDNCFPSAKAPKTTDGQLVKRWAAPGTAPITRDTEMGGNIGAQTTAEFTDYKCVDNRDNITCPDHNVIWGGSIEDPGLDNLLLKVSIDADGRVVSAQGFWTNEYHIKAGPPIFQVADDHDNSWQGGYMQLTGAAE